MAAAIMDKPVFNVKKYEGFDYFKLVFEIEKYTSTQHLCGAVRNSKFQFESSIPGLIYIWKASLSRYRTPHDYLSLKCQNSFKFDFHTETIIFNKFAKRLFENNCIEIVGLHEYTIDLLISEHLKKCLIDDTYILVCHMYCKPKNVTEICPSIQMPTSALKYNFENFLQNSEYTDITLRTTDGTTIRCHKLILSAVSSVFKAMLQTNMQESVNSEIFVEDVSMPVLKKLLKYIYGGDVQPLTFEGAMELYYAADKYHVIPLRDVCANVLKLGMSKDNAHDILKLACDHSDKILYGEALKVLEQNYKDWR